MEKAPVESSVAVLARAFVVWLVFIVAESILGSLRTLFLEPRIGVTGAKQIGFVTGSFALLVIAWLMVRWIGVVRRRALLAVGLLWAGLTFGFEISVGLALGRSWDELLADYNPLRGGLMWLALLLLLLAPVMATALRALGRDNQS